MCIQLTFDLPEFDSKRDPFMCQHLIRTAYEIKAGEVLCGLGGGEVFTNCHESLAGEPPKCVHEPPDNSQEALARRKEFFRKEENE